MATIKIPALAPLGRDAAPGDLLAGWDAVLNKTVSIDIANLPAGGGGGGGGGGTALGSPFKVRVTSPSYAYVGGNSVITDIRLIGVEDAVVSNTQSNVEFRDEDLTFDPIAGTVTINGFELTDPDHITITTDGILSADMSDFIAATAAREALLLQIAAPFLVTALGPNGGKVFWGKPAADIPAGWQEYTAQRGYVPIAQDPADIYDAVTNPDGLNRAVGTPGGSKTHTNTLDEMMPHTHAYDDDKPAVAVDFGSGSTRPSYTNTTNAAKNTASTGGVLGAAKPYSILNPYRIVMWIEFIGV